MTKQQTPAQNGPAGTPATASTAQQWIGDDPRSRHPKHHAPEQHQPEQGLDVKTDPVPDIGLDSYTGLGRLAGRKALITGGDSGIGAAVAVAYAREGADVAIAYQIGRAHV